MIRAGRRGTQGLWVLVLAVLCVVFIAALANAIAQRTVGDAGGVGHVFLPFAGASFTFLLFWVVAARWWEDETLFRVHGDHLEVRHGFGSFHWPAVRMDVHAPVTFAGDGGHGAYRVFVEQGGKRVLLGPADAIVPLQYTHWAQWMRHHGIVVDLRWDVGNS